MSDPNVGQKLADRYELVELIGQGAMGRVYRAEDTLLGGVIVAVKFLSQTLLSQKMRERFVQEAMTCAQLGQNSMHVVKVTDYGVREKDEVPFYVMEYLQGESLSTLISQKNLPIPRFLRLVRQICLGLNAAHEGIRIRGYVKPISIIHRDIKPSNILVTQDATLGELAKVLDFGIAKLMQEDSEQTSSFMGTLAYASPEQMEGKELDNRSDIYSLGILMYQMLTGRLPLRAASHTFGGWYKVHHMEQPQSIDQIDPHIKVPPKLASLVMKCLEKKPSDRPQSIDEILTALKPLEEIYVRGLEIGEGIGKLLDQVPIVPKLGKVADKLTELDEPTKFSKPHAEDICRQAFWPSNKPIAEIVFPHIIKKTGKTPITTLWVMLPPAEIAKRLRGTRYNTFICTMAPHPMVLWLTVLYNQRHGTRWLPCYLDLKTRAGQEMAFQLGKAGTYKVLFFSTEQPKQCAHIEICNVADPQQKLLQGWVMSARTRPSVGSPATSKKMLKDELNNNMKEKITKQLEALYLDTY